MKRLRVTFTLDEVHFDVIKNGTLDRLKHKEMKRMPDCDYQAIAETMAKKLGIEDIDNNISYISKG